MQISSNCLFAPYKTRDASWVQEVRKDVQCILRLRANHSQKCCLVRNIGHIDGILQKSKQISHSKNPLSKGQFYRESLIYETEQHAFIYLSCFLCVFNISTTRISHLNVVDILSSFLVVFYHLTVGKPLTVSHYCGAKTYYSFCAICKINFVNGFDDPLGIV